MIWIASLIGGWILFSAIVVLALCAISSRCSKIEGREERWESQQQRPVRVRSSAPAAGSAR